MVEKWHFFVSDLLLDLLRTGYLFLSAAEAEDGRTRFRRADLESLLRSGWDSERDRSSGQSYVSGTFFSGILELIFDFLCLCI